MEKSKGNLNVLASTFLPSIKCEQKNSPGHDFECGRFSFHVAVKRTDFQPWHTSGTLTVFSPWGRNSWCRLSPGWQSGC